MTGTLIIVGAPRSGTNILRDVLTSVPGFATWPCDEINLLWKHHNRNVDHDELTATHASAAARSYLHDKFSAIRRRYNADWVVEKTCATSLRVSFAAAVFPDAKFVFIRRDGLDAAASTIRRWDAPFDAGYVARKLRYAPLTDLPFYAAQFVTKRLASRRASADGRLEASRQVESWWGPRPRDYRKLQRSHPLDELAILQWQRCVDLAQKDLGVLPTTQVHEVRYEDFARQPDAALDELLQFTGCSVSPPTSVTDRVSARSIGKGRAEFDHEQTARLTFLARETLAGLGYA